MHSHRILNIPHPAIPLRENLRNELNISSILAQLLINRGIASAREAEVFLAASTAHLIDPFRFTAMPKAVEAIRRAASQRARVLIFGDYDVDGVTALVLLTRCLSAMGCDVRHYIPHRLKEGYGLNQAVVRVAHDHKASLVVTVDCGSSSHREVAALRKLGMEVIITDHHESSSDEALPATAVINPKIKGSGYPYRDLAGVGVAYKLAQALAKGHCKSELDLVALGTIADVVPLTGENRIFVKQGLEVLSQGARPGVRALMETSRLKEKKLTAGYVSYIIGPRINASGRMDTAETALSLLMSEDLDEARGYAETIEVHNRTRQKVEGRMLEEAQAIIDREINFKDHKVIVLAKDDWHAGVLGIVASKLAERYYRPTILISIGEERCKGSGRSIKSFHLFDALKECQESLSDFGGHSHAVGLVIAKDKIAEFRDRINEFAGSRLCLEDLLRRVDVDMELPLTEVSEALIEDLAVMEPFGAGNPEPQFYVQSLKLKGPPQLLARDTLKCWVSDGKTTYAAVGFGMGSLYQSFVSAGALDLVYTPRFDRFREDSSIVLEMRDVFFK